MSKDIIQR